MQGILKVFSENKSLEELSGLLTYSNKQPLFKLLARPSLLVEKAMVAKQNAKKINYATFC